jgi:hypothetical protein
MTFIITDNYGGGAYFPEEQTYFLVGIYVEHMFWNAGHTNW